MTSMIHLVKLSVGTDTPETLEAWQKSRAALHPERLPQHVTRMWPKREDELLAGGSIYWVIKGSIQCRQRIVRLDEVIGEDGIRRCAIVLDREVIRTTNAVKRPFQGWRYLTAEDAPKDLAKGRENDDAIPADLAGKLAEIGVL
ncbi:DUF1489 domain-containing protein [Lentibacter algarum]|uniref:DUF1489 family protein n=1 Tax=Lentibacter algarum TaxID=576131 RepID=UPI001C08FD08|nr:DUF1489 domain-containing protein [Lentibacter algarum]MBU2983119.1 DUF1489 domain-containing protein [Lentibacter algarum]